MQPPALGTQPAPGMGALTYCMYLSLDREEEVLPQGPQSLWIVGPQGVSHLPALGWV